MKLFLILLLSFNLFASNKHLSSEIRAEVFAQNLVDSGEYKKAKEFLKKAKAKYPKSEALWMFSATVAYELKDFNEAKINFIKTLEINPKNEQASAFKEIIAKQESALENKSLEDIFAYLNDKGIDFLSIFLAFLGGEIIARKYAKCRSIDERNIAKQFKSKDELSSSISSRVLFATRNYICLKNSPSFCSFLHLLIIFLISCSLLIFFLLFELLVGVHFLSSIPLNHMGTSQLWVYVLENFAIFVIITIVLQILMYSSHLKNSSENIEIELTQYLETLSAESKLDKLYELIKEFKKLNVSEESILSELLSDECKEKIRYFYRKK
ncbi:tetratricopeptide repeat protein [Arcobacter peruensis]|uniref:tetratricopeptide repeat protein n=1 Tax=Arcobacter peruensis TaxID=2320140 RepID=UPI000F084177|nr:tetratricopeptide repeat protein [Arcobacter peruensis]